MLRIRWLQKAKWRWEDKSGNDNADRIADESVKLHGKEAVETGAIFTRRHEQYVKLIEEMYNHCLKVFVMKRKLEEESGNGTER